MAGSAAIHGMMTASIMQWYEEDPVNRFDAVIGNARPHNLSLRLIDFFVVNYARVHRVWWILHGEPFEPHADYTARCTVLRKVHFDPFCRGERIHYRGVATTLGQMNFFRWAQEVKVLEYVAAHDDIILPYMKSVFAARNKNRQARGAGRAGKQALCAETPAAMGVACGVRTDVERDPIPRVDARVGLVSVYELD